MPSLAKEFMDAERRKMRLQATLAARRNSLMTMGRPDLSTMFGGAAPYMSPEDKRLLWEQTAPAEPKTLPDVDMSQPLSFVSSPYQRRPQTRTNPDARSVNPHGDPGLWDSLLHWPGTTVLSSGQQMAGNREGLDTVLSDGSVMRTAGGQGLSDEPTYGGLRVPQPQARPLTEFQDTVLPGSFVPRPDDLPGRAAADATILQNQADILGTPGVNLNAENARRIAATVAHNNLMRPGRIADANARLLPESGFSQGAIDSLYEDRAAAQAAAPPLAQRAAQSSYGPGLTPAAAEERYGPGGMYGTQPLPGGLYDQQGITSSTSSARPVSGGSAPRSAASQGLTDSIKQIKKRAGIIRGTVALVGGDTRAADRYEAKAMASLGIYAGEYAMSQLTDADFQSKQKLFQALRKNGMPIDQIIDVIQSGVADAPTTELKDQQKQVFIDADGKEHAGKIAWDDKGGLRYLKRDGTLAPDDWVPRQASSKQPINIGVSLGEKPDIAVKKSMIKRSALMMAEAKKYWIDEDGKLRDELGLGDALGWKGPARTTKSKMKRALSIALRLESGAAIGEDERAQFYDLFMPNYKDWLTGDREAAIIDKFDDFQKYIEMIVEAIDPAYNDESIRDVFHEVLEQAKDDRRVLAEAAKTALTIEEKKELEKLKQIAGED